jgi:hypothetical protein
VTQDPATVELSGTVLAKQWPLPTPFVIEYVHVVAQTVLTLCQWRQCTLLTDGAALRVLLCCTQVRAHVAHAV